MLFFRRFALAGEIEKLGAEEPDALAAVFERMRGFLGEFDVSEDLNFDAIGGDRLERGHLAECHLVVAAFDFFGEVVLDGVEIRLDDHETAGAVEDDGVAIGEISPESAQPDDRGDAQRPGHDRGVTGLAAKVRCDGYDLVPVEADGLAWGEFAGDDDRVVFQFLERVPVLAHEVRQHAAGQIRDVVDLGRKGRVRHRPESIRPLIEDLVDGVLGGDGLVPDDRLDRAAQHLVAEHADVEAEDLGGLVSHVPLGLVADPDEFFHREIKRLGEPGELVIGIGGGDGSLGYPFGFVVEDENPPDNDARRNPNTRKSFHRVPRNPATPPLAAPEPGYCGELSGLRAIVDRRLDSGTTPGRYSVVRGGFLHPMPDGCQRTRGLHKPQQ